MVARINGEMIVGTADSPIADELRSGMMAAELKRVEEENRMLRELLSEAKERIELYAWALENERLRNMELQGQLDRKKSRLYNRMLAKLARA